MGTVMAGSKVARRSFGSGRWRVWGMSLAVVLVAGVVGPAPAALAAADVLASQAVAPAGAPTAAPAPAPAAASAPAAAAEDPDLTKFQKVVLGQGPELGEAMELTVADDGRVFFVTRAGDISMYDPTTGSIEIIMNSPELGVWSGLEDGLLGITLDPDFDTNHWIYVYYAPLPESYNKNRLSRLTLEVNGGETYIDKTSEKVLLEVGTQRNICCHSAGSLQFDRRGDLYLATGDNTSSSDNDGFSPHDERPGRSDYDAQKSSGNTNDLRGKILRITPRNDDAGDINPTPGDGISYDIPDGNLFGEGGQFPNAKYPNVDAAKTRPEPYVMGLRNPYRLGLDADTDVLYWGEVGPDSRTNSLNRGPRHQEEFNRTTEAMNGGWPYCGGWVGDDLTNMDFGGAYVDWDFVANRFRTNPDGSPKRFPCNDPNGMQGVNDSPNSTGLTDIPPMTDAWIPYSDVAPYKYPEVQGGTPIGGQIYRQSQNTAAKETAFPAHYEGSYFMAEMSRGWIKEVRMDASGQIQSINDFMGGFVAPGDLEFGPDGSLYVIEYGNGWFSGSEQTKLVRIDYAVNGRAPQVKMSADPVEGTSAPLNVTFSSAGTSDPDGDTLTYAWDFDNDGDIDSTVANPSYSYPALGDFNAVLTVTDSTGKSATAQTSISVGNTRPKVDLQLPVDGGFYDSGDDITYKAVVTDAEESVDCQNVTFQEGLGHDSHVHPNLSVKGCEGTIRTAASADHGPDANTYGVFSAIYNDHGANGGANGPLTGQDNVTLQPKHRQAEHATDRNGVGYTGYDDKSGTRPGGGGLITGMGNGNWVMFDPMSLVNMTEVSLTYSGGAGGDAAIELRAGAANGPVAARIPLNGGTAGQYFYKTVSGQITSRVADAGGRPLYLVYTGAGEINLDEMDFKGSGIASNVAPTISSLTASPADGAAPLEVDFAATVSDTDGDSVTYSWDFGVEGTTADTSTEQNPTYTYAEPGLYTATLTAKDSTGKERSRSVDVRARRGCPTAPTADAGYSLLFNGSNVSDWKQSGPGGFTVEDCNLTSYGGLGMLWYSAKQFKDYSLKLQFKLSDDGDNSGVFQRFPDPGNDPFVAVNEGHEIQIKEGQPGDEPQKTGSVYNFDREDDRNAKPVGEWNDYEIQVVGQTYTMTLNGKVVNTYISDGSRGIEGFIGLQNHGTADEATFRNIQIKELDIAEPFVNKVSATPTRGAAPLVVDLAAEGVDRQGDTITYDWDFGDGTPVATGAAAALKHTYAEGGTFTPKVTPVDADGNRGTTRTLPEVTVEVDPVPQASASPRCGVAPLKVDFTGNATDPQSQTLTYAWDFGVAGTGDDVSTAKSPSYTYTQAGKYTATLVVTDPDGNKGTQTLAIEALASGECRAVADLTSFFNNDGISTHGNPGDGNFDSGGWAYAAETLPESIRQAGGPIELDGVDYDFPSPADGLLNNVEADGQTIPLPSGSFDELKFLGSAHNGDVQAQVTVTYADGSTAQLPLRFTDWAVSPKFGEKIVIDMPHRHNGSGDTGPRVYLFSQTVAVDPTKDVVSVTLPTEPKLHLFAISGAKQTVAPPCDMRRSDEFNDGNLTNNCNWQIRRANPDLYKMEGGALKLTTGPGEYGSAPNLVAQPAPSGAWTTTTKLTFDPTKSGQQAGLVVAGAGGSGFLKLMFVRKSDGGNEWIEFLKSSNPDNQFDFSGNWNTGGGSFDGPFLPTDFPTTFWLRLSSDGTNVTGSYSTDGDQFTQVGDPRALSGIDSPSVGVLALRGGGADAAEAAYDFFRFGGDSEPGTPPVVAIEEPEVTSCSRSDDFAGSSLDESRWNAIARKDDSLYKLEGGDLVVTTHGSELQDAAKNLILQETPDGRFTAVTKLNFASTAEGQQAGMLLADVPGNDYLKLAFVNKGNGNRWIEFLRAENGGFDFSGNWHSGPGGDFSGPFLPADFGDNVYLRLSTTDGEIFKGEFSKDGQTWESAGDDRAGFGSAQDIGVYGLHNGSNTATAKFGWFGAAPERDCPDNRPPTVEAAADTTTGDAPLTVKFQGQGADPDGDQLSYAWDFGDGKTSTEADPTHIYTQPGTYPAKVTVTDPAGEKATDTIEITVKAPATGKTWVVDAVDTATDNQWVSVDTGTSEVTIKTGDTVTWEFDRATMAHDLTSQNTGATWSPALQEYRNPNGAPISYTFTKPGVYHYYCSIHGATMKGTVVVEDAGNRPPTATPYVEPRTGDAPLPVHFEARAADPDGDPLTYKWDFGTGNPADSSTEDHAHFSYTKPGDYTATLEVSDGKGGVLKREFAIKVIGQNPTVTANATPTAGIAPLTVNFGATGQDDQGGVLTYTWDFGDPTSPDNTATGQRTAHTYAKPGDYLATVTATDADGNKGTSTVAITVAGDSKVTVTATPESGTAPLEVAFDTAVESNQTATEGEFKPFADGTTTYAGLKGTASMVRNVGSTKTTISLTGLKHHAEHMVHVHEQPCGQANGGAHYRFDDQQPFSEANEIWLPFTANMDGASGEVTVTKPRRAGAKAVSIVVHDPDNPALRIACVDLAPAELDYAWDFGDGSTGTGKSPKHTYTKAGEYTAKVTVTDGYGLELTGSVKVVVTEAGGPGEAPTVTVAVDPPTGTAPLTVKFTADGKDPEGGALTYAWDFGDGATGSGKTPTHVYSKAGEYTATVTATDPDGNEATASVVIKVSGGSGPGDTTAPDTTIESGPKPLSRSRNAVFRFSSTEPQGASFRCSIDGAAYVACRSHQVYRDLSDGRHTLSVVAVDGAGNVDATPATWVWEVDSHKPQINVKSPKHSTSDRTPTISATVTDDGNRLSASQATVTVDGQWLRAELAANGQLSADVRTTLGRGRHKAKITVVDQAGNRSTQGWTFTVTR